MYDIGDVIYYSENEHTHNRVIPCKIIEASWSKEGGWSYTVTTPEGHLIQDVSEDNFEISDDSSVWISSPRLKEKPLAPKHDPYTSQPIAGPMAQVHFYLATLGHGERGLSIEVEWDIFDFIAHGLNSPQELETVLTITGEPDKAYACSCKDYVKLIWGGDRSYFVGRHHLVCHLPKSVFL